MLCCAGFSYLVGLIVLCLFILMLYVFSYCCVLLVYLYYAFTGLLILVFGGAVFWVVGLDVGWTIETVLVGCVCILGVELGLRIGVVGVCGVVFWIWMY